MPLVFSRDAMAGTVWTQAGRYPVSHMTVVGSRILYINSDGARQSQSTKLHKDYDRQTRLFGISGQEILAGLKVSGRQNLSACKVEANSHQNSHQRKLASHS